MSDPQVSGQAPANEVLPEPKFANGGEATSPTSKDAQDLEERIAERVASRLAKDIEKAAQSTKDKRFSELDKMKRAGLLEQLQKRKVEIPDDVLQDVERESRVEQLERSIEELRGSRTSPGKAESGGQDFWATVKTDVELDFSDPRVIEYVQKVGRGDFSTQAEALLEAHRVEKKIKTPPPPVTSGESAAKPAKPAGGPSPEKTKADYIEEVTALSAQPLSNAQKLDALKAMREKYLAMGFDPGSVGFSR